MIASSQLCGLQCRRILEIRISTGAALGYAAPRGTARRAIIVSTPYLGEIRLVGFNFAPVGWAFANGAVVAIAQNDALFNLIGTTYGGDGVQTFALPNVQSRMPMHQGQGVGLSSRVMGQTGGSETASFVSAQIPTSPQAPGQALASLSPSLSSISPLLVINFIIALQGVFPSQN
jgi:microcystin-dependent protein